MSTTLNGAINASVTSITVASAAGFPSSGVFSIVIDSEVLQVTAGWGTTTWTVVRARRGTTAASHADGTLVSVYRRVTFTRLVRGQHNPDALARAIQELHDAFDPTYGHMHTGTRDDGPGVTDYATGSIALGDLAPIANNTLLGNNTGGAASPVALTAAQAKSLLAIAAGDVSGLGTLATTYSAASLTVTSSLTMGTSAADAGHIRLPNQGWIVGRNAAGTGNVNLLQINGSDEILTDLTKTFRSGNFAGAGHIALGGTPATAGAVRLTSGEWITSMNAAGSAPIYLLKGNASDQAETDRTFVCPGFKMTASPTAGYPLISDANGLASWTQLDHGAGLTGLADDDHTQYLLASGARALTGKLTLAASGVAAASLKLPAGAAPTSPADGDAWYDSTQKCLESYVNGLQQSLSAGIFVGTADATSADTNENSIVPAGVGTVTLPANFLVAGKTLRLTMSGFLTAPGGTALRLRIKLGTTVILDTTAQTIAAATSQHWQIDALLTCRTTGATGTVHGQGRFVFFTAATAPAAVEFGPNTSAVTVDTTAAKAVAVTALWSAHTTESITTTNCTLEVLG